MLKGVIYLVAEYEIAKDSTENTCHHEQTIQAQRVFLQKVGKLSSIIHDMGNTFQEESSDLPTLDT